MYVASSRRQVGHDQEINQIPHHNGDQRFSEIHYSWF